MTDQNPYQKFSETELITRDLLALDRTKLANERTLLAYLRSGVALVLAGVTLVHFAATSWLAWVGIACVPLGIAEEMVSKDGAVLIFGTWRFMATARRLRHIH